MMTDQFFIHHNRIDPKVLPLHEHPPWIVLVLMCYIVVFIGLLGVFATAIEALVRWVV